MIRKRLMTEINLASLKFADNFSSSFYSEDFHEILISTLEHKYGGVFKSHRAAKIIQLAYRKFRLRQKLNVELSYGKISTMHCRNNSMPDNLHYIDDDYGANSSVEDGSRVFSIKRNLHSARIKDSLSLLLPELQLSSTTRPSTSDSSNTDTDNHFQDEILVYNCQFKVGDVLSSKCEEDLENFQNDSFKTESTEDSDSSSDKAPESTTLVKLPPPMPVISTSILSTRTDLLKTKMSLFSFEKLPDNGELLGQVGPAIVGGTIGGRSPRDSGVSSHSSNADLITMDYPGHWAENGKAHNGNCLLLQRGQSAVPSFGMATVTISDKSCAAQIVYTESESVSDTNIAPITEDRDSLFDSLVPPIPSVMTSSKDSGVDADSASSLSNHTGHYRRLSIQEKSIHWRLFHHHSCFTGCVSESSNRSSDKKERTPKPDPPSPCLTHTIGESDPNSGGDFSESQYKELLNRVLYRVAVNLFNRNTSVGLKFMADHKIFNVKCPTEIANFLRSRDVNPQVLADYICSRESVFNLQVLRCFLESLSLQNLSFLDAFEVFIGCFKLPGDSVKINFLIAQFCQYYLRYVQRCPGCDIRCLLGLSAIIVSLRSSVVMSRINSSDHSVLSFSDFVKNIQNCFKGQQMIYSMEVLQKTYISMTRSSVESGNLTETLINRITDVDECKSKSNPTTRRNRGAMSSGYLQQQYRRLTYCCDVQQCKVYGKRLKKNEHLRSIFVFNDTVVVAKRLSLMSPRQSKLFRTDSSFQCKSIINLLNYRVAKVTCPGPSYQISITVPGDSSAAESSFFVCDSESSRDKLLSKINISQLESQCVEQLRLQQWNCCHDQSVCMCVSIIRSRLPKVRPLQVTGEL